MSGTRRGLSSKDIARLAGVSQATVSRVLSGSARISEATRAKVMRVVEDVGYTPNAIAQAMRTRQSRTVGVAVSRVTNPVVPEILEAFGARLSALGRRMVVWNTDSEGEAAVIEAIRQGTVDGVVFTAASHQRTAIDEARARRLPLTLFNRPLPEVDCDQIVSDNRNGARTLARYLLSGGRRRIAYLSGPLDRTTLLERDRGFSDALAEAEQPLWQHCGAEKVFDQQRFRQLAILLMQRAERPDAIACGNDMIAFAVLNGLASLGVRVPEDVWVAGFDGVAMSGWDLFDLTTMQQPWDVMADAAVATLIDQIDGNDSRAGIARSEATLVVRGSTDHWHPPAQHHDKQRSPNGRNQ
ncbi:MAG: LacI family DNA-binding transcriptional regulator [Pseudomonadota bacterium]